MFEVDITLKVNASFERVWRIISNVNNDTDYWKEIHQIKNISQEGNVIVRDAYLSNGDKYRQRITLFPKEGIHIRWASGTVTGIKDIMLIDNGNTTVIRVQINYKNGGAIRIVGSNILQKFKTETENALKLIKEEAECRSCDNIIEK